MSNTPKINFFEDNTTLVMAFGKEITEKLATAIEANDHASLVVSGGSTPKSLFQFLAKQNLDWSKVTITLADERCLPPTHKDSNAYLLHENLLIDHAIKATFIPLFEQNETPSIAATNASVRLENINIFDVVILGIGTDGHTASLFPQASNLTEALANNAPACLAIDPVTNDMLRVTQSKVRLLNTANIYFHLVGKNKLSILNAVLADSDTNTYPASHFIHQSAVPVNIYFASNK